MTPGFAASSSRSGEHLDGTVTTAMPVVNAIPMVCAAPPGIVNQMELPLVRATHQFRS